MFTLRTLSPLKAMTINSTVLARLAKVVDEVINLATDSVYHITTIPVETDLLALPALIILVKNRTAPEQGVGYHTLIVDSVNAQFPPMMQRIGDKTVMLDRSAMDVYDNVFMDVISRMVKDSLQNTAYADSPLHTADAQVVPTNFSPDDKAAAHTFVSDAVMAATSKLMQGQTDFQDFDIKARDIPRMYLDDDFANRDLTDHFGNPIRDDINLVLKIDQQQQPALSNWVAPKLQVGSAAGYVDVIPVRDGKWLPRFVLTKLAGTGVMSMENQLLMLAMATVVADDCRWHASFFQSPTAIRTGKVSKFFNVNLLSPTLNANVTNPEKTKAAFNEVFAPGMAFSLDIPMAGDSTWYNQRFAAAAVSETAANDVIRAADNLTMGRFSKYFTKGERVVSSINEVVHLGYFTSDSGQKLDIRCLDQLAVMSLLQELNPLAVEAWTTSFTDTDVPIVARLAERMKIIQDVLPNFTLTGTAQRVTFLADFISSLRMAVNEAGYHAKVKPSYIQNQRPEFPRELVMLSGQRGPFDFHQEGSYQGQTSGRPRWE